MFGCRSNKLSRQAGRAACQRPHARTLMRSSNSDCCWYRDKNTRKFRYGLQFLNGRGPLNSGHLQAWPARNLEFEWLDWLQGCVRRPEARPGDSHSACIAVSLRCCRGAQACQGQRTRQCAWTTLCAHCCRRRCRQAMLESRHSISCLHELLLQTCHCRPAAVQGHIVVET